MNTPMVIALRRLGREHARDRRTKALMRRLRAWHRWHLERSVKAWHWIVAWDEAYHAAEQRLVELGIA